MRKKRKNKRGRVTKNVYIDEQEMSYKEKNIKKNTKREN